MANVDDDKVSKILSHLDSIHSMCDGFKTRLDTIEQSHTEMGARLAKLEKAAGADDPDSDVRLDQDAHRFAEVQLRADRGFQAWSRQAPPGLGGERLADYRRRLLKQLQPYSERHKGTDLARVLDPNAFDRIEDEIINDAVEASNKNVVLGAPLRTIETRDPNSGHIVRRFIGDPHVTWAPFMGGAVSFGKIVRQQSARP